MAKLTFEIDDHTTDRLLSLAKSKDLTLEDAVSFVLERTLFGVAKQVSATVADYRPQHIPVMIDDTADGIKKHFRCITCGNIVFSYYGSVKLITNGIYDAKNAQIEGDERPWSDPLGKPTELVCQGRVMPEGYSGKVSCRNVYYKIGS